MVKADKQEQARHVLTRLAPEANVTATTPLELSKAEVPESATVANLFKKGRATNTLLFWLAFFMCLLTMYALGSWMPKLMMAAGYSMGSSLLFLLAMNIGAVIGTVSGGMLADRFHLKPVIMVLGVVGAIVLSLLGFEPPQVALYLMIALAGAASIGSQILLYSYVAQYYPVAVRSTGIGWASAVGRSGAIIGPILIGMLLGMDLPHQYNFIAVGIPLLVVAIAVTLISKQDQAEEVEVKTAAVARN